MLKAVRPNKRSINVLILFLFFHPGIAQAEFEPPKNPNSAKGCAICHYRWVDTFFIEGKGSDIVPYQSEKVAASKEICFSCHDGSVIDSRARAYNDNMHKVNHKPPEHMEIPKTFPLDNKGEMQCATCHTAHGVPSGEGGKQTLFMRSSNIGSALCRTCHPDKDGGPGKGHHPDVSKNRKIPASLETKGRVILEKKNQIVCETCHTAHGSPYNAYLIKNSGDSKLCIECHQDKDIFTENGSRKPFHIINTRPSTLKIPDELIKKGSKMGDNGNITCLTCHKLHNNLEEDQLLLIKNDNTSGLCLTCHKDKIYLAKTKHNLAKSAPREKNLQGKTVAQAGICSSCHLPHKAARKLDGKGDLTTQLCMSCHGKGKLAQKDYLAGYSHPVDIALFNKQTPQNLLNTVNVTKDKLTLPLFNRFGIKDQNGRMTCATCHNPHKWREDHGSNQHNLGMEKTTKTTPFLRKTSPAICAECHQNKFHIAGSKHDLNLIAPLEKNIIGQTISESGLCGGCHLTHSAQKGFLWARSTPETEKGDTHNLCIGCHNKNGMAKEKVITTNSHPVEISPGQKGIKTTLPLFDLEGNISQKGLLTCYTCHDPHKWSMAKSNTSLKDPLKIEGGIKNSFLRLSNSPSPLLCKNCHSEKGYIEKTDHDLSISAPESKNILGQTPSQSGICGTCHLVHNGRYSIRLWAQGFGKGESIMEKMCNFCHQENGTAKQKIPQISSHPKGKIVNLGKNIKGKSNYFPLFDRNTGEPVIIENISCPSCHDLHKWNSNFLQMGTNTGEGNANNSFLRTQASIMLCKDCHGIEALFKYKFYHKLSERKIKAAMP